MHTISLKLPDELEARVEAEAERRNSTKSAVIRECLEESLMKPRRKKRVSCLDLMRDLIGSQPGPRDASTNKKYLLDLGDEGKRSR